MGKLRGPKLEIACNEFNLQLKTTSNSKVENISNYRLDFLQILKFSLVDYTKFKKCLKRRQPPTENDL